MKFRPQNAPRLNEASQTVLKSTKELPPTQLKCQSGSTYR